MLYPIRGSKQTCFIHVLLQCNSMNIVCILVELAHKYGKCVIIITHAAEVAERADVVLKMDDGVLKSK